MKSAVEVVKILRCDLKFIIHFLLQIVMSENRDNYAIGAYCNIFLVRTVFPFFTFLDA
jgi:hypothetical protein